MQTVNIHEAKTNMSRLLEAVEAVEAGEEVVIARAGRAVATLPAYKRPRNKIFPPGSMEGEIWMAEDFDAPLDDQFDCLKEYIADPLDQV